MQNDVKIKVGAERVHVSPLWISNGHWLISKACLKPGDMTWNSQETAQAVFPKAQIDTMKDEAMENAKPDTNGFRRFDITGLYWRHPQRGIFVDHAIFMDGKGQVALFDNHYITMFGITALYGDNPDNAFVDDCNQIAFILMPIKNNLIYKISTDKNK